MRYSGRGRRPIWCSAKCRVEASIERRGNRMVGVEPRVIRVVDAPPPPKSDDPVPPRGSGRRAVQAWATELETLRQALVSGAIYDRELGELAQALDGVLNAFERRARRR